MKRMPKPGDHFVATWGYGQTNKTFWRVERVTPSGKSVEVTEVVNRVLETAGQAGGTMDYVVPGSSPRMRPTGEWETDAEGRMVQEMEPATDMKRLKWHDGEPSFKAFSWGTHAHLWDGKPQGQTNPLYGH